MKYEELRKKYPKFVYENYFYRISSQNLEIFFEFKIEPNIYFRPKIIIENIPKNKCSRWNLEHLDNLVFHLGLMEIPSYWKATCSPEIEIKAGFLNREQIKWWKDLILKGMGQFFYENKINFTKQNFLKIKIDSNLNKYTYVDLLRPRDRVLVPVGGGRDAIVTLELLKKRSKKINVFLVNPTKAAKEVLKVAKIKNSIIVRREIDPTLLKLNQKGFLNGHTPFTAVLSFLAVFCAVLFDYKNIAFSNEKSANEGNLIYLGKMINHQWSKSSEFERKFKYYCKKYLAKEINYFSLLRPYTELEISKMFLKYPQYFSVFSSCNVGQKTRRRWCGNCPKCLFVYATLYPFLEKKELLKIFGKDFFDASASSARGKKLLSVMRALIEQGRAKPFECVGTKKENRLAFSLCLKKAKKTGKIPFLLRKI